jgi:hypothetical protein
MTTHAMIDLETLCTLPTAQVLTIGAVKFDPNSSTDPHSDYYHRINIDEQDAKGRTMDQRTLDEFWAVQSPEIVEEAFSDKDRQTVESVLLSLRKWLVGVDNIWCQGSFDNVILENMYRQWNIPIPWAFWQIDNCRSVFKVMPSDPRKKYTFAAHNALADAKVQARALQDTLKHLGVKLK